MIDEYYLGVYWHGRPLTLREYADASCDFLRLLQNMHPVFHSFEWSGNRPDCTAKLSPDLNNLDALIYHNNNKPKRIVYKNANPDGSVSWQSLSPLGYSMGYFTGMSASAGGLEVDIHAGEDGPSSHNAVIISFPPPNDTRFPHREFYNYDFLKNLFAQVIAFWRPQEGLLTSIAFSNTMAGAQLPRVGWLTYARDPRAAALRNSPALKDLLFETTPDGGTLISLGRAPISPENTLQVEQARRLRQVLIDEHIVQS